MKQIVKSALICTIIAASLLYGEVTFAGSNVFTFPSMTGIKTQPFTQKPVFFKSSIVHPSSRIVTFSWSFPLHSQKTQGIITVYSLHGKVVAKVPVEKNSGSTAWNIADSQCRSGIYIARINYGTNRQNLKLMLWN